MKAHALLPVALAITLAGFAQVAHAQAGRSVTTGNDLLSICQSTSSDDAWFCLGYVTGVSQATQLAKVACSSEDAWNTEHLRNVFLRYLADHPETRDLSAAEPAVHAFIEAFPCKTQAADSRNKEDVRVDSAQAAVQALSEIADEIRACPESVSIRQTSDKKLPFSAIHEGPPTDVRFDVQPSDSLVAPFQGTVEFSTHTWFSQKAKTPEQAASALEQKYLIFRGIETRHRYFYRMGESGVQLDHRTLFNDRQESVLEQGQPEKCWQLVGYK